MSSIILLLVTLLLGAVGALVLLYHRVNFWTRKGIPHIQPVPIFGTQHILFFGQMNLYNFISHVYNSFPNARYFGMMDMHTPEIALRDPELIKEMCVKNFDNFLDHRRNFLDENMDPIFGKNLFSLQGDRWKKMRYTLSPCFSATKMKFMFELIAKCSRHFAQHFIDHPDEAKSVEMKDAFTRYTCDVIATTAFGISANSVQDRDNEFYLKGKDATEFDSVPRLLKVLAFRICPRVMKLIGVPFLPRASVRFFKKIVHDTVKMREEQNIIRPDMIHLLMEARDKDNGIELTLDDIIGQSFAFFFAGFETSSTLMCFIAYALAVNPKIQERVREEVDSFTKNDDSDISYETISKMKYLDMVMSEVLRMYPPSPATDRMCVKSFNLPKPTLESREYTVERDTVIWIPIYALHHDPQYFPDPEKFDPERFSDENKDTINPYAYLPFGLGPRKCLGYRFALMMTKVLFVYILKNFVLEKSEKTKHPIEFDTGFHVNLKGGCWVKLSRRK